MSEQELNTERLIFAALLKAASEQATYLTGTLKFDMKYQFKNLVLQMDRFVNDIEAKLPSGGLKVFEDITDCYHNFNIELRRSTNMNYDRLTEQENNNLKKSNT
jgi:hypothetical protein